MEGQNHDLSDNSFDELAHSSISQTSEHPQDLATDHNELSNHVAAQDNSQPRTKRRKIIYGLMLAAFVVLLAGAIWLVNSPLIRNYLASANHKSNQPVASESYLATTGAGFIGSSINRSVPQNVPVTTTSAQQKCPLAGTHVALNLFPQDAAQSYYPCRWMADFDAAYELYSDLVGEVPFGGQQITVVELSTLSQQGAWALSGNPIQWNADYVSRQIYENNQFDEISFGLIHELGHDFDIDGYINNGSSYRIGDHDAINAEMWANFKLCYVADNIGQKDPDAKFSTSFGYISVNGYCQRNFDQQFAQPWISAHRTDWQNMSNDTMDGLLYTLVEKYGWGPFKAVFRDYSSITGYGPSDDVGKIQLFVDTLNKHTPASVTADFRSWGFPIN